MKTYTIICSLILAACSSSVSELDESGSTSKQGLSPNAEAHLKRISEFQSARGNSALLRDEPAQAAFTAIKGNRKKMTDKVAVYDLAAPGDVVASVAKRARELGMPATANIHSELRARGAGGHNHGLALAGDLRLKINATSGNETFADVARNHHGLGILLKDLKLSESDAVALGAKHLDKAFGANNHKHLYAYKVRRYMGAAAPRGGQAEEATVNQLGVAFNSSVDGVPVIGPGGKMAVQLSTSGDVVAHEHSVRPLASKLAEFAVSDLISAEEAQGRVEARLRAQGVDLGMFELKRSEFGYFRRGRNSVQKVIAPHYLFVYEPTPGNLGKQLVEFEPALPPGNILDKVLADQKEDEQRKQLQIAGLEDDHKEPAAE